MGNRNIYFEVRKIMLFNKYGVWEKNVIFWMLIDLVKNLKVEGFNLGSELVYVSWLLRDCYIIEKEFEDKYEFYRKECR